MGIGHRAYLTLLRTAVVSLANYNLALSCINDIRSQIDENSDAIDLLGNHLIHTTNIKTRYLIQKEIESQNKLNQALRLKNTFSQRKLIINKPKITTMTYDQLAAEIE